MASVQITRAFPTQLSISAAGQTADTTYGWFVDTSQTDQNFLFQRIGGRSKSVTGATLNVSLGTWESLGVPAGATITGITASSVWFGSDMATASSLLMNIIIRTLIPPYENFQVASNSIGLLTTVAAYPAGTLLTNNTTRSFSTGSDQNVTLQMYCDLSTGSSSSAYIRVRINKVQFTVTYTGGEVALDGAANGETQTLTITLVNGAPSGEQNALHGEAAGSVLSAPASVSSSGAATGQRSPVVSGQTLLPAVSLLDGHIYSQLFSSPTFNTGIFGGQSQSQNDAFQQGVIVGSTASVVDGLATGSGVTSASAPTASVSVLSGSASAESGAEAYGESVEASAQIISGTVSGGMGAEAYGEILSSVISLTRGSASASANALGSDLIISSSLINGEALGGIGAQALGDMVFSALSMLSGSAEASAETTGRTISVLGSVFGATTSADATSQSVETHTTVELGVGQAMGIRNIEVDGVTLDLNVAPVVSGQGSGAAVTNHVTALCSTDVLPGAFSAAAGANGEQFINHSQLVSGEPTGVRIATQEGAFFQADWLFVPGKGSASISQSEFQMLARAHIVKLPQTLCVTSHDAKKRFFVKTRPPTI